MIFYSQQTSYATFLYPIKKGTLLRVEKTTEETHKGENVSTDNGCLA